jgi:hypothetical protein
VTILAVLNIIFGAFGLFSLFGLIIHLIMPRAWMSSHYASLMSVPGYKASILVSDILHVGMGVLLLACGIGLLRLRDWARKGSMAYAVIGIIVVVVSTALFFAWQMPAMEAAGVSVYQIGIMRASAFIWPVLGLGHPVVLLSLLTRPMIKVQFGHQISSGAPGGIPMPHDGAKK